MSKVSLSVIPEAPKPSHGLTWEEFHRREGRAKKLPKKKTKGGGNVRHPQTIETIETLSRFISEHGRLTVKEMAAATGIPRVRVSHALRIMREEAE